MITIPVKIKREDKVIMIRLLENVISYMSDFLNINNIISYEVCTDILSKLRASQHNDKAIRINIIQVGFFFETLKIYSNIGLYEQTNADIILGQMKKEIHKRTNQLYRTT